MQNTQPGVDFEGFFAMCDADLVRTTTFESKDNEMLLKELVDDLPENLPTGIPGVSSYHSSHTQLPLTVLPENLPTCIPVVFSYHSSQLPTAAFNVLPVSPSSSPVLTQVRKAELQIMFPKMALKEVLNEDNFQRFQKSPSFTILTKKERSYVLHLRRNLVACEYSRNYRNTQKKVLADSQHDNELLREENRSLREQLEDLRRQCQSRRDLI